MSAGRRLDPRKLIALLGGAWLFAHLCFGFLPWAFEPWNLRAQDVLFRGRQGTGWGVPEVDPRFVCVSFTDEDRPLGTEPGTFERITRNLRALGAALQMHDAVYTKHDPTAFDDTCIVGRVARLDTEPGSEKEITALPWTIIVEGDDAGLPGSGRPEEGSKRVRAAAGGEGFLDVDDDADGVHRRLPLLARGPNGHYPSLVLAAAVVYLGVDIEKIVLRPGESLTLPGRERTVVIPIDERAQMRVNFVPWSKWPHKSFTDIDDTGRNKGRFELHKPDIEGAIVTVAEASTFGQDIAPTPLHAHDPLPGLHAAALHTIVTEQFLSEWGLLAMLPLELAMLVALYFLAWRSRTSTFLLGITALITCFVVAVIVLFCFGGVIIHAARPMYMLVLATVALTAYRYLTEERLRARVQGSFEAFFPPRVVRKLLEKPERVRVGGERKVLTMLFSDIKGFTARTADMDPADVQEMLNTYFEEMVDIVFAHGGTLDKFIGDGLMVFFGDPEPQPDHAARGVRCAVAMQRRLRELAKEWAQEAKPPIQIRVGLHTGEVVVGNMGSPKRLSYTVLGSAVNLAARLEPKAPTGGVLISERTRLALPAGEFQTREVEPIEAKGFGQPVRAHIVEID